MPSAGFLRGPLRTGCLHRVSAGVGQPYNISAQQPSFHGCFTGSQVKGLVPCESHQGQDKGIPQGAEWRARSLGRLEIRTERAVSTILPALNFCRNLRSALDFPHDAELALEPVLSRSATPADIRATFQVRFIEGCNGRNN